MHLFVIQSVESILGDHMEPISSSKGEYFEKTRKYQNPESSLQRYKQKRKSKKLKDKINSIRKSACQIIKEADQIRIDSDEEGGDLVEVIKQLADQIKITADHIDVRLKQNRRNEKINKSEEKPA